MQRRRTKNKRVKPIIRGVCVPLFEYGHPPTLTLTLHPNKAPTGRTLKFRGDVARKIDAFSKANNGLIRYEDMAAFKAEVEEPVSTSYHGYTVYKPGFWSQGPAMIETLNILESYPDRQPNNSPEYVHRLTEALKLAYADRDAYFGDPRFNKIPTATLLSKEYAAQRRRQITARASNSFQPGVIDGKVGLHPATAEMAHVKIDDVLMAKDTTCVDAIDADGIEWQSITMQKPNVERAR